MSDWTQVVGWALIHFLWQGAVLAIAGAGALRLCRSRSANTRYASACGALAGMLAAPVVTAMVLSQPVSAVSHRVANTAAIATSPTPATMLDGVLSEPSLHIAWTQVDRALPLVVVAWLIGVALLLIRMAGGLWRVRRIQTAALAAAVSRRQATSERLAARLGVRIKVHVVESARVAVPMAVGWLRPVILLPIAALAHLTPSQVEAILAHELVHIRRHDYIVNVVQTLAETLLFYHPAVWWVSERIRVEREHCCDDVAVDICGDAVGYAEALAELAAWRTDGISLAPAATGGPLAGRVRRLLGVRSGPAPRSTNWVVMLALTAALVVGVAQQLPIFGFEPATAAAASAQQHDGPIASPDSFDWQTRVTDHFELHYYPALEADLDMIETAAETAYELLSTELIYHLPFRVPVVLFKDRTEFAQQEIAPGATANQDINAFSEPRRDRIVLLVDDGTRVPHLLKHELTHIFMFDIVPRELGVRIVPVWLDEGLADYMTGVWQPLDLGGLRSLVADGRVPRMSQLESSDEFENARMPTLLGHAVFDFIEARYGKARVRQFLFELRRDVVDRTGDLYQAAFNLTPEEFDDAFERYLRERFSIARRITPSAHPSAAQLR